VLSVLLRFGLGIDRSFLALANPRATPGSRGQDIDSSTYVRTQIAARSLQ
jgi:hypothetical protein